MTGLFFMACGQALPGLVFEQGLAGLIGVGDLCRGHVLYSFGTGRPVLGDLGPALLGRRQQALALGGMEHVGGDVDLLFPAPVSDLPVEVGGGPFFLLGLAGAVPRRRCLWPARLSWPPRGAPSRQASVTPGAGGRPRAGPSGPAGRGRPAVAF